MADESPIRMLVVDDEPGIREGCRRILEENGYEVETAEDGRLGIDILSKSDDFAVILVDLKMPRMGGLEFIEKAQEYGEDSVIIVITAYTSIQTAVEATKRGAYGYLPKPFTPDELLLVVKNGLEKRALSLEMKKLRMERERQLLEVTFERSRCATIIDCMTDGVVVVNCDGQMVLRNSAAARILPDCGVVELPVPLNSLSCVQLRDVIKSSLSESAPGEIVSREISVGSYTYMANVSQVLDKGGRALGTVAVLRDITAIKKLENAKNVFVSMVAHEVKSPLAAIEGYLNLLLGGGLENDPEKSREMLSRTLLRAGKLREMISELLSLRAIETGHFDIKRSPIDLIRVVEEAVQANVEKAREQDIELSSKLDKPSEDAKVLADRNAILTVMKNLLDNAIKYTPSGGRVGIELRVDDSFVKIIVSDTGIGIAPDLKDKIFDEFFRVRNELTAHIAGTGLGLSLVRRLVDMHNGRITVESEPGKGSVFEVKIPAV